MAKETVWVLARWSDSSSLAMGINLTVHRTQAAGLEAVRSWIIEDDRDRRLNQESSSDDEEEDDEDEEKLKKAEEKARIEEADRKEMEE